MNVWVILFKFIAYGFCLIMLFKNGRQKDLFGTLFFGFLTVANAVMLS
jgi:hypothetical protein